MKNTLSVQLGIMVGKYIVKTYLPTLNTYYIKSNNLVKVSQEDHEKYWKLDKLWDEVYGKNNELAKKYWNELRSFDNELHKKYLPECIDCYLREEIIPENMDEFAYGIEYALRDCDISSYTLADNWFSNESYDRCTTIKLKMKLYEIK